MPGERDAHRLALYQHRGMINRRSDTRGSSSFAFAVGRADARRSNQDKSENYNDTVQIVIHVRGRGAEETRRPRRKPPRRRTEMSKRCLHLIIDAN